MGQANPFFERAGFVRVGVIRKRRPRGDRGVRVSAETAAKSRFREPVDYVFDNRGRPDALSRGRSQSP